MMASKHRAVAARDSKLISIVLASLESEWARQHARPCGRWGKVALSWFQFNAGSICPRSAGSHQRTESSGSLQNRGNSWR